MTEENGLVRGKKKNTKYKDRIICLVKQYFIIS